MRVEVIKIRSSEEQGPVKRVRGDMSRHVCVGRPILIQTQDGVFRTEVVSDILSGESDGIPYYTCYVGRHVYVVRWLDAYS